MHAIAESETMGTTDPKSGHERFDSFAQTNFPGDRGILKNSSSRRGDGAHPHENEEILPRREENKNLVENVKRDATQISIVKERPGSDQSIVFGFSCLNKGREGNLFMLFICFILINLSFSSACHEMFLLN